MPSFNEIVAIYVCVLSAWYLFECKRNETIDRFQVGIGSNLYVHVYLGIFRVPDTEEGRRESTTISE